MVAKIRNSFIFIMLAYLTGMVAYNFTATSRVREKLVKIHGESVTLSSVDFTDWYLQNPTRTGEIVFTYNELKPMTAPDPKDSGRGLSKKELAMNVKVVGRWWPKVVETSNSRPAPRR